MIECRNSNRFPRFRRLPVTFKMDHSNYWPSQKRGHQQNCHATFWRVCHAMRITTLKTNMVHLGAPARRDSFLEASCIWFSFWIFWYRCSSFLQIILGYFSKDAPGEVNVIPGKKSCCTPVGARCCQLLGIPNDLNHKCFLISWNWTDWKQESPEIWWFWWGRRGNCDNIC